MPRYPAMESGERRLARLSGAARARGFPAMRDARTAGELTGGDWFRRPEGWGLDSSRAPRPRTQVEEPELERDRTKIETAQAQHASNGFALGSTSGAGQMASQVTGLGNLQEQVELSSLPAPRGSQALQGGQPGDMYTSPTVVTVDPFEDLGGFAMPDSPPPPEAPSTPPPSSTSSPTSAPSSAGSVLTIGALLAFLFS